MHQHATVPESNHSTAASTAPLATNTLAAASASTISIQPRSSLSQPFPATISSTLNESITRQQPNSPQPNDIPLSKFPLPPRFDTPLTITRSLLQKLPLLTSQKPHYITAHLHARPYLLTEGDELRLPFLMPRVKPGDILRFNRASVIGSRDFTLKGGKDAAPPQSQLEEVGLSAAPTPNYLDERLFECRVRVVGVDAEPLQIKEKTKRRQRHVRTVKSKHKHTLMRVMHVRVKTAEELLAEGAVVVEDADVHDSVSPASVEARA